jgi:hypothetical protein
LDFSTGTGFMTARLAFIALVLTHAAPVRSQAPPARRSERVILVTLDGVRWQELFGGADSILLAHRGAVRDTAETRARFWRATTEERRAALFPFLWGTLVREGQLFGDSAQGAGAYVTNGLWFSYPGYNELLAGAADPRIDSNDKLPNPNRTVLEFLNGRPCCRGRVAAWGSWDVLPFIVNAARSGIPTNGDGAPFPRPGTDRERLITEMSSDLPLTFGAAVRLDAPTMQGAQEWLRSRAPAVLYVMLGETDEWAHDGRYDLYLDAGLRADRYLERLWRWAQSDPRYRGRTTLVVTTDHGRGEADRWTSHGRDVPAARRIWIGVIGPDTPPLGVRRNVETTQAQVAATVAALLGEDLRSMAPGAAAPLPLRPR